jgi:hypothetical protein
MAPVEWVGFHDASAQMEGRPKVVSSKSNVIPAAVHV